MLVLHMIVQKPSMSHLYLVQYAVCCMDASGGMLADMMCREANAETMVADHAHLESALIYSKE